MKTDYVSNAHCLLVHHTLYYIVFVCAFWISGDFFHTVSIWCFFLAVVSLSKHSIFKLSARIMVAAILSYWAVWERFDGSYFRMIFWRFEASWLSNYSFGCSSTSTIKQTIEQQQQQQTLLKQESLNGTPIYSRPPLRRQMIPMSILIRSLSS